MLKEDSKRSRGNNENVIYITLVVTNILVKSICHIGIELCEVQIGAGVTVMMH